MRGNLVKFAAGLATGSAIAIALGLGATAADARDRNRDRAPQRPDEFAATLPSAAPIPPSTTGSIFQVSDGYAALHEGTRARRRGDPVTIVLVERTAASKSAGTNLSSNGNSGINLPPVGPLAVLDPGALRLGGDRGFQGSGTADQANTLTGEISVTVAEVYPNGTMLVQGQKRVTLNRGDEFIQIRGIVRIADIDAYNRVASTRVADARIAYTGKGDVARAARQGWFSRFFQMISPF